MDFGIQNVIVPLVAFLVPAIGLLIREIHYRRKAKRQAALDAGKILNEKKALIEEMMAKIDDDSQKEELHSELERVNAALWGLHEKRLAQTLKDAGLPPKETLIAGGRRWLQRQQVVQLKKVIEEVKSPPPPISAQDFLLMLANAYYHVQRYRDTKSIYDQILNLNPDDPDALNNRGVTYAKLGRYDEALADFNQSLELRPDDPRTLYNRGNIYAKPPPLPHAFYGTVQINGREAPIGTKVEATGEGVLTGIAGNPIVTTKLGRYGSADPLGGKLVVQGNIVKGATITFYVNDVCAGQTATWHSGEVTQLNLTASIVGPARETAE